MQNPMPVTNRTPVSCLISQDAEPNARNTSYLLFRVWFHKMQNPMPVTNRTPCLVCDTTRRRIQYPFPEHIVPPVSWVISQDAEPNARNKSCPLSRVGYHKMQSPMPETCCTPCLVCDITRSRSQCPWQIVPVVSCMISKNAEPNASNKS